MKLADVVSNGIKYYSKDDFDTALKLFKKAIPLANNYNDFGIIYYNIGLCHFSKMNYVAAEKSFEKSFINYDYLSSGYELSMTKLFLNKLEEGIEYYKYRYYGNRKSFPDLPLKMAKNLDDLKDKKVLVLNEQGFGDEILFSRSIDKISKLASEVTYQIYDEMFDLFNDNFSSDNLKLFTDRTLSYDLVNSFDVWIPSGDLFFLFILRDGFDYKELNSNIIQNDSENIKVGLTFKTNVLSKNTEMRSMPLDKIEPVLNRYGIEVFSLQKDYSNEWINKTEINSFKDTSDIIDRLDYVVTVDTVVAHLSGMKNKKTILIYDKYIDWRWNYNFYKSIELVHILELGKYFE